MSADERIKAARQHWLTAVRLAHDAEEEYLAAVREKADPAVIAMLRERAIGWKGVEDGATAIYRIIEGLEQRKGPINSTKAASSPSRTRRRCSRKARTRFNGSTGAARVASASFSASTTAPSPRKGG